MSFVCSEPQIILPIVRFLPEAFNDKTLAICCKREKHSYFILWQWWCSKHHYLKRGDFKVSLSGIVGTVSQMN